MIKPGSKYWYKMGSTPILRNKNKRRTEMTKMQELQLRCRELEALNCRYHNAYLQLRKENTELKINLSILKPLVKNLEEWKSKEIPKKVKCHIKLPKGRIAGYCPTCDGTVDIKLTWLVEHKGHRCSWCGQAIDLTGVEME